MVRLGNPTTGRRRPSVDLVRGLLRATDASGLACQGQFSSVSGKTGVRHVDEKFQGQTKGEERISLSLSLCLSLYLSLLLFCCRVNPPALVCGFGPRGETRSGGFYIAESTREFSPGSISWKLRAAIIASFSLAFCAFRFCPEEL